MRFTHCYKFHHSTPLFNFTQAVLQLSEHFKTFRSIRQIATLLDSVLSIQNNLQRIVFAEFEGRLVVFGVDFLHFIWFLSSSWFVWVFAFTVAICLCINPYHSYSHTYFHRFPCSYCYNLNEEFVATWGSSVALLQLLTRPLLQLWF